MKILITDMLHASAAEERNVCEAYGLDLDTTYCATEDEIIEHGQGASGLIISYSKITRRIFESLPELKVVVKYGIGVDTIDLDAATDHKVMVANVPDYCLEEVASHALMLLLCGLKQTPFFDRSIRDGLWMKQPNEKILYRPSEVSLGLVSFGRIARTLAGYALPIFKEICYYDPFVGADVSPGCKKIDSLEDLFRRCTVLSVHTPLTGTTRHLIDERIISFADKAILVNTSRADVIDPKAVSAGLDKENLIFFGADTFWPEPPIFSDSWAKSFLDRTDVLITPHCGWCSLTAEREVRRKAAEAAAKASVGRWPDSVLNKSELVNRL